MDTTQRTVKLHQAQADFINSPALYRAMVGGVGSGKSRIGALDLITKAKRGRLYLVCAPTYPMLSDASFRSFIDRAEDLGLIGPGDVKKSPPPSVQLKTGAEVLFRTAEKPDHLRGPNISGIWMDEASLVKEEVYDILIGRLREGGEQGWLSATFTPKGKSHWTYKKFATGQPNTALFRARTSDNPFLPPQFYANLRAQYSSTQSEQELEGQFLDIGGAHFTPGTWPRFTNLGDAITVPDGLRRRLIHGSEITILASIDVALSLKDTSDFTSMMAAGLTPDGLLVILDVVNERIRLVDIGRRFDEFCGRWHPHIAAGDDDNLSQAMLMEYRRWPNIPELRCMPIGNRPKIIRAQDAIIAGEGKRIYLPVAAPWLEAFNDQLAAFSGVDKTEHDDMVDCLGIIARLARLLRAPAQQYDEPIVLGEGKATW